MFWVQILPLTLPPPQHFLIFLILYNTFMYIVQYRLFLVHIPHTQHHNLSPSLLPTNPLPLDQPLPSSSPHPRPDHPFLHFHNNFNSLFTSIRTPPPPNPIPPTPLDYFLIFTKISILCTHPP